MYPRTEPTPAQAHSAERAAVALSTPVVPAQNRSLRPDRLLTPGEVASLFRVDPKTVTRWAAAGRIGSIRTPGGHRRFREAEVRALLSGEGLESPEA